MSFHNLPDELLVQIANYLHPVPGPQFSKAHWGLLAESESHDICQLANASRRLYNICRPRLYSTFIQNGNESLILLVRTLISRPDLRQYVRYVNVVPGRNDYNLESVGSYNAKEIGALDTAMYQFAIDPELDILKWNKGKKYLGWQCFVAMLLLIIPNLEELTIPDFGDLDHETVGPIGEVLGRASRLQIRSMTIPDPDALQHLRRISIGWNRSVPRDPYNDWGTIDIKYIMPYLTLPTVTSIHAFELRTDPVSPTSWSMCENLPTAQFITTLHLERCNLARETIRNFLRPFKALHHFHYEEGGKIVGPYYADPHGFVDALLHVKTTLKSFTYLNRHTHHDSELSRARLGSFAEFTALTTIDTMSFSLLRPGFAGTYLKPITYLKPMHIIKLHSVIPRSLQSLTLREFNLRATLFQLCCA